jgi:hypothetical protein
MLVESKAMGDPPAAVGPPQPMEQVLSPISFSDISTRNTSSKPIIGKSGAGHKLVGLVAALAETVYAESRAPDLADPRSRTC